MAKTKYTVEQIADGSYVVHEFGLDVMYVIIGTKRALVVDAGTGVGDFKELIEEMTSLPYDVVATHGHGDHVGGSGQFEEIYIHPKDMDMLQSVSLEFRKNYCEAILQQYPQYKDLINPDEMVDYPTPKALPIHQGDSFDLGDRVLQVYEAPGHTPGSIILIDSKTKQIYSGDAYNPLFLLVMPGEDRMAVVREFYTHAKALLQKKEAEGLGHFYSGHDAPLPDVVLPDLCKCCEGILDGSIKPEYTEVHIFKGEFCNYGTAHIVYDPAMLQRR